MLISGRCSTHPSRDAHARCRHCGSWLCERCTRLIAAHAYCGIRCRSLDIWEGLKRRVTALLRTRVATPWSMTLVAAASALLLTVVGVLVAELLELASRGVREPGVTSQSEPPSLEGRIEHVEEGWRVTATGPPGLSILVIADGRVLGALTLDDSGTGEVSVPRLAELDPAVHLVPLGRGAVSLAAPAPPQSSPTAAAIPRRPRAGVRPTPTAPHTPTPRPRATPRRASPAPADSPPVLQLVHDAGDRIAVTFDGGSTTNGTVGLLDMLDHLDMRVTLFLTGEFIEQHPEMVRLAVLAGHEIGNHTYDHPRLTTYATNRRHDLLRNVNREWFVDQLRRTEGAYGHATGRQLAPLWRAPYGEENATLRQWALEEGYLHVRWSSLRGASLDARDWVDDEHSSLYQDSTRMMRRLLSFPRLRGGIVLMHVSTERDVPPWEALPSFVGELRSRGIEIVPMTGLLDASPTWQPWLQRARDHNRSRSAPMPPRR